MLSYREISKPFAEVAAGDRTYMGVVAATEADPFMLGDGSIGRHGWTVFDDGMRSAQSATVTVIEPIEIEGFDNDGLRAAIIAAGWAESEVEIWMTGGNVHNVVIVLHRDATDIPTRLGVPIEGHGGQADCYIIFGDAGFGSRDGYDIDGGEAFMDGRLNAGLFDARTEDGWCESVREFYDEARCFGSLTEIAEYMVAEARKAQADLIGVVQ